jgi:opacity protein-like surface antigen
VRAALSSRKGLLMVMVALALAFVAAMMVSATAAHAQPTKKRAYCHARGNGTYGFIFVQQNSGADKAHQRHLSRPAPKTDIFLGSGFTSRAEARASFEERCTGGTTTTTTGQPPTTTTTTGQPPTTTTTGKVIITPPDNAKKVGFTKFEGVKKTVFFDVQKNVFFITVNKEAVVVEKDVIVFTEDVPAAAAQYQYSASPSPGPLPDTGGSGLLPLAALVLLLGGGTAAFIVVKRGIIG